MTPAPGEVLVEVHTAPDSQGRQRLTARWCDETGVRGQVFYTRLDRFTADAERRGQTVREVSQ